MEWRSRADWKDPNWKYKKSTETDVARTIQRVKREMKAIEEQKKPILVQIKKTAVK
jgi:hypothetical protein